MLHEIKTAIKKMLETAVHTISSLANALEKLRGTMIHCRYVINFANKRKIAKSFEAARLKTNYDDYLSVATELKSKIYERKAAQAEKEKTPPIKLFRHKELTQQINELSEQIEELKTDKNTILANLHTNDIQAVKNKIADIQKALPVMERHSNESTAKLDNTQKEYAELKEQAQNFDIDELYYLRRNIRPQVGYDTEAELYEICGASFSRGIFNTIKSETDNSIDGNEIYSVCRQLENYKQQQNEQKHEKHRSSHDEDELEL